MLSLGPRPRFDPFVWGYSMAIDRQQVGSEHTNL